MTKDFQASLEHRQALDLSADELASYEALANNESAVRELGDKALKVSAVELIQKLRKSTTIDW